MNVGKKMSQLSEAQEDFELQAEEIEVVKTVTVTVHGFTKRIDEDILKGKKISPPAFKVGDTRFTVSIYPQDCWKQNYIAVYLHNEEKEYITATYSVKHASGVEQTFKNVEIKPNNGHGFRDFLSHKAYKKWAKNHGDVFKVEIKIILHIKKAHWTSNREPKVKYDPVVEASSYKNNEKLFTDFAILSKEGKRFPCHRFILSSQSKTLMAMLTTDMKEKKEGQMKLEYSDEVVENFVDYFYTRTVPREVLKENMEGFMSLSELYDLAPLKHQTEEVAVEQMTTENMIDMFALSNLYNADTLKEASELFIKENRDKLAELDLSGRSYPANVISDIFRLFV